MKRLSALAALFMLVCILLGGCSAASQVEDQAYVLVMGLDRSGDGRLEMCVQIPRVAGNSGEDSSGGANGSENYLKLSVKADGYEAALEKLDWASPRNVNFAQIKLIVLSRAIAEEAECGELIEHIAQTERLFTAARMVVCEGSARDFVESIQPNVGARISTDIEAMFKHYNDRGYVPVSRLAEFYYQSKSVYSDPMITYALLKEADTEKEGDGREDAQASEALSGSIEGLSQDYESEIGARYLGAAVFAQGRMRGIFTGMQTILANLMRNELKSFRYECADQSLELVPTRPVYIHVDTSGEIPIIRINAKLSYAAQEKAPDENLLREKLEADIRNTIHSAQQMGAEPFGFAEAAARSFLTLEKWTAYDWRIRFKSAGVEIKLSFAQADA